MALNSLCADHWAGSGSVCDLLISLGPLTDTRSSLTPFGASPDGRVEDGGPIRGGKHSRLCRCYLFLARSGSEGDGVQAESRRIALHHHGDEPGLNQGGPQRIACKASAVGHEDVATRQGCPMTVKDVERRDRTHGGHIKRIFEPSLGDVTGYLLQIRQLYKCETGRL